MKRSSVFSKLAAVLAAPAVAVWVHSSQAKAAQGTLSLLPNVRKFVADIDLRIGYDTIVQHNLGTKSVLVALRDKEHNMAVQINHELVDENAIKITHYASGLLGTYSKHEVVVIG